ncbi:hypothetical protein REPUB_Repub02eG0200100 [Reevesia pubescens]
MNGRKHALCRYDFPLENGWVEEKDLFDLLSGYKYLSCFPDYRVVHIRDDNLCVIRSGIDGLGSFIRYDIFQVSEHKRKKKNYKNESRLVHLASSRFTIDDNQETLVYPIACFPMQVIPST